MTAAYPLHWPQGWPRTAGDHRLSRSPFTASYEKARRQLYDELRLLGAKSVVLSSNVPIRQDGHPYGDHARRIIDDPGAALYFDLRGKPMAMARDLYWTVHDNIRSLGLAIEHLRGLERHGGGVMMERAFSGFAALPPPGTPANKSWREVLAVEATCQTLSVAEAAYRRLAAAHHPDRGGSHARMAEINAAIAAARRELKP